jgi:hypothetical protein
MGRVEKPALRRWSRARYLIIQVQRDGRAFLSHRDRLCVPKTSSFLIT